MSRARNIHTNAYTRLRGLFGTHLPKLDNADRAKIDEYKKLITDTAKLPPKSEEEVRQILADEIQVVFDENPGLKEYFDKLGGVHLTRDTRSSATFTMHTSIELVDHTKPKNEWDVGVSVNFNPRGCEQLPAEVLREILRHELSHNIVEADSTAEMVAAGRLAIKTDAKGGVNGAIRKVMGRYRNKRHVRQIELDCDKTLCKNPHVRAAQFELLAESKGNGLLAELSSSMPGEAPTKFARVRQFQQMVAAKRQPSPTPF